MKPMMAITARITKDDKQKRYSVNAEYVESLLEAGANPVMLLSNEKEDLEEIMKHCQGLVITGGVDINPALYHQEVSHSIDIDDHQDAHDYACIEIALKLNIPILGICRGLQVLNAYFKGTLHQDIHQAYPQISFHDHSSKPNQVVYHDININDGFLSNFFDCRVRVNSYHHQAIDRLGEGLKAIASGDDGIIEAIEANHVYAVQWHPERLKEHLKLFQWFVEVCNHC